MDIFRHGFFAAFCESDQVPDTTEYHHQLFPETGSLEGNFEHLYFSQVFFVCRYRKCERQPLLEGIMGNRASPQVFVDRFRECDKVLDIAK